MVLKAKGGDVWSVGPETTVLEALEKMADKDIGALVVLDGDRLVGIVSERDYARKVILHGKRSSETQVREVMSPNVVTVTPEQSLQDCMALMTARRCRHLPVLDGKRLAGVISIGDVVKAIISDQAFMISQLENYISGGR
jgi:CBS domain-containing protein